MTTLARWGLTLLFLSLLCTCGRAQGTTPTFTELADSFARYVAELPTDYARAAAYTRMIRWKYRSDSAFTFMALERLADLAAAEPAGEYDLLLANYQALVARQYESPQVAATLLEAALAEAGPDTPLEYLASAEKDLGEVLMAIGRKTDALPYLQEALSHYRELKHGEKISLLLNSLGRLYRSQQNYPLAIQYYEEALEEYRKTGLIVLEGTIYNNLAGVYNAMKEQDKAIEYYDKAIEVAYSDSPPRLALAASALANKGNIYRQNGQFRQGLDAYQEAYPILQKTAARKSKAGTLLGIGRCLDGLGRHEEAKDIFYQVLEEGGVYENVRLVTYQSLFQTYISLGIADSARHYAKLNIELNGKIQQENNAEAMAEMEAKYATAEQQREIERLEFEESLNEARIARLGWWLGFGLLALGIFAFLAYRNFHQRQQIAQQNVLIQKSLSEKETLMKEIHHRVKNNLQMVSSLLTLQSDYIQDNVALDALASGRSRVRSMALIHQKLYLDEQVATAVNARDYLEKLIEEVTESLQAPGQQVQRIIDVADVELDIDLMIPLGLITNELITNAMKYAFAKQESGLLSISFQPVGKNYRLAVADNGCGFQVEANHGDSFGNHLVNTLADQLEAKVNIQSGPKGTMHTFEFDPSDVLG